MREARPVDRAGFHSGDKGEVHLIHSTVSDFCPTEPPEDLTLTSLPSEDGDVIDTGDESRQKALVYLSALRELLAMVSHRYVQAKD